MRDVELEEIKEYAVEDADVTLQLKEIFTLELDKTETKKLFEEIEICANLKSNDPEEIIWINCELVCRAKNFDPEEVNLVSL